jgi:hypothetical protein
VRVGRFDTEDEVLPLSIVAEKSPATGCDRASSTEHFKGGRGRLVFNCQMLQAGMDQRPRRSGKIGCGTAHADIAAKIKPAPAREGGGADAVHRCRRLRGAAQDRDILKIVVGGQRVR